MEYYTLLADDNQHLSQQAELYPYFRAHVIYNMIVGGGMVFSDNQVICSSNLRKLAREDGVVRQLFKEKRFGLALRDSFQKEGLSSLRDVFQAFLDEGKVKHAARTFDEELQFIEGHSVIKPWSYDRVRQNYTRSCVDMIDSHFRGRLPRATHDHLMAELDVEKRRDGGGLGRQFLQTRLPNFLAEKKLFDDPALFKLLKDCTEAPYLSNLPETIGLNPIYTEEQKPSFDLLRGHHESDLHDTEEPTDLRPKLDYKHFVHGLNQLDITDIFDLLERPAFCSYRALMKTPETASSHDELHAAFVELNLQIEDRIISRYPAIKVHSPQAEARKVRKVVASRIEKGALVLLDLVGVALLFGHVDLLIPGIAIAPFINITKRKVEGEERPYLDAAVHEVRKQKLQAYLQQKGRDDIITVVEQVKSSATFANEVMVA